MKTLNVPEWELENALDRWRAKEKLSKPSYRFARCWFCGVILIFGMWHVFFRKAEREAHLCGKCAKPYEVEI